MKKLFKKIIKWQPFELLELFGLFKPRFQTIWTKLNQNKPLNPQTYLNQNLNLNQIEPFKLLSCSFTFPNQTVADF